MSPSIDKVVPMPHFAPITEQQVFDFYQTIPQHPTDVRVLEVIEMTAAPAEPESFYGLFLPQRLREDLSRPNGRFSRGRAQSL